MASSAAWTTAVVTASPVTRFPFHRRGREPRAHDVQPAGGAPLEDAGSPLLPGRLTGHTAPTLPPGAEGTEPRTRTQEPQQGLARLSPSWPPASLRALPPLGFAAHRSGTEARGLWAWPSAWVRGREGAGSSLKPARGRLADVQTTGLNIAVGLPGTRYSRCPVIDAPRGTASAEKAEPTARPGVAAQPPGHGDQPHPERPGRVWCARAGPRGCAEQAHTGTCVSGRGDGPPWPGCGWTVGPAVRPGPSAAVASAGG